MKTDIRWAAAILALGHMGLMAIGPAGGLGWQPELQKILFLLTLLLFLTQCVRAATYWLNPFFLFGLTTTIFLSGRILASLMSSTLPYTVGDWFYFGLLDPSALSLAIGAIGLFCCGVSLALKPGAEVPVPVRDDSLLRFALIALILLLPFFILRASENIRLYQAADYLSLYLNGGPGGLVYKSGGWFILAVFAALAARPGPVLACILAGLGLTFCVLESLTGARGIPLAQMVMLCWLLAAVLGLKVKWPVFVLAMLVLILFADFMGRARTGIGTEFDLFGVFEQVGGFIHSQGTTLLFVVGVADHLDAFSLADAFKASFALPYDLLNGYGSALNGQGVGAYGAHTASLSHQVANMVNTEMYQGGMGIGGSAVGEAMLYSVYLGPLAAGIFTGALMRLMFWVAGFGAMGLMWFAYTFAFVLLVPRENQFYFVVPGIKALLFLLVFYVVKKANEKIRSRYGSKCDGHRPNLS
ncbi:O-antigen polysaccharide polymerase Wzy [Kerstersia gyiorum]|jgi:hypothetical protein|uniref:O-antigen polysaccharide polymerase Wzy n=1 Tax=Kerstersia gyiorum TaxID=206506 RepID=UPI00242F1953|nr:O-antigen polysaccharide polymerase Wzy [Kerstersia gyiorum]MCH4273342.1 O-antigen polysaccharide polymerase Wzy family protein [Kerstersia gyiorum]MCI1228817.1 O-antigen polysaccharide polymerase Wzy family protein [Kerstersia gyiorum]